MRQASSGQLIGAGYWRASAARSKLQTRFCRVLCLVAVVIWIGGGAAQADTHLLAFGDSLTAGYGLAPEEGFVPRLEAALALQAPVKIVNAGVSGDTSAAGLNRLDWSLADHPDAVILELGANDMLRGIDPAATAQNLDKILSRLRDAKIPVLLCGMKSVGNWGPQYQAKFDAIFPDLAKKYGVAFYPFFLDGVALNPALIQADGLHPNQAGVAVIVSRILPSVQKLIGHQS